MMNQPHESNQSVNEGEVVHTWALILIRAGQVLQGGVAGRGGMLALKQLSRLRA